MNKFLLTILLSLISITGFSQKNNIRLIESAIGLSQSELKTFLRGVLEGREPQRAPHTVRIAYTLDNSDVHLDYYITEDSCLSAGIVFKNSFEYDKTEEEITSTCPKQEGMENTYYKISINKRIVYYIFSRKDLTVVAMDKTFLVRR